MKKPIQKDSGRSVEEGAWEFDDGSRWEFGDTMAGGAHADSKVINDEMVPGFITLRIVSANGDEQQHRYTLAPVSSDTLVGATVPGSRFPHG